MNGEHPNRIIVYGDPVDEASLAQLKRCLVSEGDRGVLCADHHKGYSMPIGGVVAYEDYVSPSGVGYDIACGNKAVKTNLRVEDVGTGGSFRVPAREPLSGRTPGEGELGSPDETGRNEASVHAYSRPESALARIMDEIVRRISFGVGRVNNEPADHPVLDRIREADFAPQRELLDLASKQLGTVGAGNHYVDLFSDEDGWLWVGVHFGSRGFGHKTASGFLALAQGLQFTDHGKEGEMDSPPVLLRLDSDLGQSYLAAMSLAGEYSYAGRDTVVAKVLEILGAEVAEEVHAHHNFAWREEHDGDEVMVIRKGATPIWPGQRSFVGGSMGDISVIIEGIDGDEARDALYSTVHGAGRVMSRTQAAGKFRKVVDPKTGRKRRERDPSTALIDFDAVRADLAEKNILLRGGAADEAPGVYKRIEEVLGHHAGSIRVVHTLTPLGVAMAGADVLDPYKD